LEIARVNPVTCGGNPRELLVALWFEEVGHATSSIKEQDYRKKKTTISINNFYI
jgi:hypothetical protein